jgi:hypothetical protein
MRNLLTAALWYAGHGLPVFPCRPRGKTPITEHGFHDATTDQQKIRQWWTETPAANIGMPTGAVSGLIVLDIDPRNGGEEALETLIRQHGRLPETAEQITGGGGRHYVFRHAGRPVKCASLAPGVDVKGDGGYILTAPSIHPSGREYTWDGIAGAKALRSLADAPEWILRGKEPEPARRVAEKIPEGQRNNTLTSLAGSMRWRGMGEDTILAALLVENRDRCEPPLPEYEVRGIAQSVGRYPPAGVKQPGSLPQDAREWLQQAVTADLITPTIVVTNRPLPDMTVDALKALVAANDPPELFVRGGQLVSIASDEQGRPIIRTATPDYMRGLIARVARCVRTTPVKGGVSETDVLPPMDLVRDLMALSVNQWDEIAGRAAFPPLDGVVEVPILRPDGSVVGVPGYDRPTRTVYRPASGTRAPEVPDHPGADHIDWARSLLDEVFGDFPYDNEASRANALAGVLTPILRRSFAAPVPALIIDAPAAGTGKTLLGQVIATIATGRGAPVMTAPRDEDEWRKKLTSVLMAGMTVILIDNVEHQLRSDTLAAMLTATEWSDRALGGNETLQLPQRATWIVTGNNIRLGGDLARRCYWVRLDAKLARPWQRGGFRHDDLLGWVAEHRGEIVAALLVLARAWFVAGRPGAPAPPLGNFGPWAKAVAGVLARAGITGFLGNLEELYDEADESAGQWEAFRHSWTSTGAIKSSSSSRSRSA